MKIYLDFDNTIFDTNSFYSDLLKILYSYGITDDEIKEYNSYNNSPLYFYRYFIHKGYPNTIKDDIESLYSKAPNYVYQDTYEFVKKYSKFISIFTYGNIEYQKLKLNISGIDQIIKNIIITDKPKYLYPIDFKNSIFIDDNPNVISGYLSMGAEKVFRVKRENNLKYNKIILINDKITEINTLNDIKDLNF